MGIGSIWHWLVLALVITVLFGSKRIPGLMSDLAGGIKAFKRGLAQPDSETAATPVPPDAEPRGHPERTTPHG